VVSRDQTTRHIDHIKARSLPEETDRDGCRRLARRGEVRGDLGPVAPFTRRALNRRDREDDPGHVLKQFRHLAAFPLQLLAVREVLVLAAAAATKERTRGIDPVG